MKNLIAFLQKQRTLHIMGLAFLCSIFILPVNAQRKEPSPLKLADDSFTAGNYYTAAKLYDQFLNPPKPKKEVSDFPLNSKHNQTTVLTGTTSRVAILYKQADAYRMANYYNEAAALYKECIEKDPLSFAGAWYWLAVCYHRLDNFTEAENAIIKYKGTGDTKYSDQAEDISNSISFIHNQMQRKDSILFRVMKLSSAIINEKGLFAPVAAGSDQYFFTSTYTDSLKVNGINPYHNRLYKTALNGSTLQPLELINIESAETINQVTGSLSPDRNTLYFTQWTNENGKLLSSLFNSTRNGDSWSKPASLSILNISSSNNKHPFISADGNTIFFASDRSGGYGQFDIWYAPVNDDGSIGNAVNAGSAVNTAADEGTPFYHSSSNTLVFSSNKTGGMGGYDLYEAHGSIADGWQVAENIGYPLNSSRDDRYFIAQENKSLLADVLFSSDRGSSCCLETYMLNKAPKQKTVTGIVRNKRSMLPIAGAELSWTEPDGTTKKVITGSDGIYHFELEGIPEKQLTITRPTYKELSTGITIAGTDESDLLVNALTATDIYLEKKLVLKPENVVTVYFDFDKYNLKTDEQGKMDSVYNILAEDLTAIIQISGYTDGLGTEEYNKILSDRRASTCAMFLIEKGIDSTRISFESFGACCPVEMELINGRDNAEGRSKNRRALINISRMKEEQD